MQFETIGRGLIAIGALVMLYAKLFMPIALPGSDVVNFHLISERQNSLMLGGLLFFAGIVLFAVFKMKQTSEERDTDKARQKERIVETRESIQAASVEATNAAKTAISKFTRGPLPTILRVGCGISAGLLIGTSAFLFLHETVQAYTQYFIESDAVILFNLVAMGLATKFAFRKIPMSKIVTQLIGCTLIFIVLGCVGGYIYVAKLQECLQTSTTPELCRASSRHR